MLNKLLLSGFILTSAVSVISSVNAMEVDDAQKTHANNSIHMGDVTIEKDAEKSTLTLNNRQIIQIFTNKEVIKTNQGHVTTNLGTFDLTVYNNTLYRYMLYPRMGGGDKGATLNADGVYKFERIMCGLIDTETGSEILSGTLYKFTLKPL